MKLIQLCNIFKQSASKYKEFDISNTEEVEKQSLNINKAIKYYYNDPNVWAHFTTQQDRIGINPKGRNHTPIGICGYPFSKIEFEREGSQFAKDRPYVHLFKPIGRGLDLSKYSKNDLDKDIDILLKNGYDIKLIKQGVSKARYKCFGGYIWNITRLCGNEDTYKWANILCNTLNYNYVFDPNGEGIIFDEEPFQIIVFVNKGTNSFKYLGTYLKSILLDKTFDIARQERKNTNQIKYLDRLIEEAKKEPINVDKVFKLIYLPNGSITEDSERINAFCSIVYNHPNIKELYDKLTPDNYDMSILILHLLKNDPSNKNLLLKLNFEYKEMEKYFYDNYKYISQLINKYPSEFAYLVYKFPPKMLKFWLKDNPNYPYKNQDDLVNIITDYQENIPINMLDFGNLKVRKIIISKAFSGDIQAAKLLNCQSQEGIDAILDLARFGNQVAVNKINNNFYLVFYDLMNRIKNGSEFFIQYLTPANLSKMDYHEIISAITALDKNNEVQKMALIKMKEYPNKDIQELIKIKLS